ncbi:MAG: hypothetical protein IJS09_10805 [Treponema sp.]|nr:hypothetical protein [Treponema sp.]
MKLLSYFFVLMVLPSVTVCAEPFFKYAEVKESTSLTIPADSEKENSYGGSAGFRLVFGKPVQNLDARTYVTLPKTKSSVFGTLSSPGDFFALLDDIRYGAGITSETVVPVSVKAGMLGLSKSTSRLENPTPSGSANPLAKSFSFSAGIGANLPTLTSSVKPLAFYADVTAPKNTLPFSLQTQCVLTEEGRAFASIVCAVPFGRLMTAQQSITVGWMKVENNVKYLADTNADFSAQWLYGALWESAFRSPWLKANLFIGFQQMPFGEGFSPWAVWIKAAARTSYKNVLIDFSYFCIPTLSAAPKAVPLMGGSSTVCRTIRQTGIAPQAQFELHNAYAAILRIGIHALFEKKILNTREAEQYSTLRLNAGFAYESKPFTTKITAGITNAVLDGRFLTDSTTPDSYYSADISSSLSLEQIKASASLGYDRYPKSAKTGNTKDNFSLDISASPGKKRMITLTGGANISYKNGEKTSSSATSSVTISLKSTFIRATIKCAMTMPM